MNDREREVLAEVVQELREWREERQRAPVQAPPVQVPPSAENFFAWLIAALGGAQPISAQDSGCDVEIAMVASADPSIAQLGDAVDLTYTVANPGTVPLVDVEVASALPEGLAFASASSGGTVDSDSAFVMWTVPNGLEAGASTTLSVGATVSGPGSLENQACTAGQDAAGNEVVACSNATVSVGVPTPTPTSTTTPTSTATVTTTATPSVTVTPSVVATGTTTPSVVATPTGYAVQWRADDAGEHHASGDSDGSD